MRRKLIKLLGDMEQSGKAIQSYVAGASAAEYLKNRMLRRAVEREFEIIGEALRLILIEDPELAARISNARQIVGFRNVLAHGYGEVDDATVWQIVTQRLPALMSEVPALIAEEKNRS
jgi:uncharacterized protein with HEPN domain